MQGWLIDSYTCVRSNPKPNMLHMWDDLTLFVTVCKLYICV